MSRYGRILPEGAYYVHAMSRVVDRRFVLGKREKEFLRALMRATAAFSGLEIVTHCIMDNHIHLLLYVPKPGDLTDEALYDRLSLIWDDEQVGEVRQRLERFKRYANPAPYLKERQTHLRRMCDLGEYMKMVKQQFTRWYNRHHDRKGTLWEARYKSVVVEGAGEPLLTMCTYIDLNPVRAGICESPEDYPWCGYGEAVAGVSAARQGLSHVALVVDGSTDWRMVLRRYRKWLYAAGEETDWAEGTEPPKAGFARDRVAGIWEADGMLTRAELLRCRVRYFTDGVGIGGKDYIEDLFASCRDRFGKRRQRGGRRMRGRPFNGLYTLRDLQVDVVR